MAEMWRARNSLSGSEGAGSGGGGGGGSGIGGETELADDQGKRPLLSVSFLSESRVSDTHIYLIFFS